MKSGKKSRWKLVLGVAITIFLVWIAYSVSNAPPPQTTTRSTLISASTSSVELAINGTNFSMYVRRDPIGGGYFVSAGLDLFHNLQVRVFILNASVTLLNMTTRDGAQRRTNMTSLVAESAYIDPLPGAYHICSEFGPFFEIPKDATIRITIYIQDPSAMEVIIVPRYFTAMNMPVRTTTSTCTGP